MDLTVIRTKSPHTIYLYHFYIRKQIFVNRELIWTQTKSSGAHWSTKMLIKQIERQDKSLLAFRQLNDRMSKSNGLTIWKYSRNLKLPTEGMLQLSLDNPFLSNLICSVSFVRRTIYQQLQQIYNNKMATLPLII